MIYEKLVFETRNELTGYDGRMKNGAYAMYGYLILLIFSAVTISRPELSPLFYQGNN
jgi:hypothetical protein